MTLIFGIALALACALATNVGFIFKHRGACQVPEVDYRHPLASAKSLFSCRTFATGFIIATGAWGFHVAAMSMAPLTVVQSVLAGGIVLLAIMAEKMLGHSMAKRQWLGIGLTAGGLILLGLTLPSVHGAHSHCTQLAFDGFEGVVVSLGLILTCARQLRLPGPHRFMMGAASGMFFAASDVAIKAISGQVGSHGILALFSLPLAVALFCSVAAFYTSASSLQGRDPVAVIAVTGTCANVGGILGGILVFGDPVSSYPLLLAGEICAFVLVIIAAWLTPAPGSRDDRAQDLAPLPILEL